MDHFTVLKRLLLGLSLALSVAISVTFLNESQTNQQMTSLESLYIPDSAQVFTMNFLYQHVRRLGEIAPEALKPYLQDYNSPPDPSFDLFYLPRRDNYCQANFLHTMLNPDGQDQYIFMDASNSDKLKKALNHDFDFLNSLVFRKKEYSKAEIERLQNMEWSPKINLFFTRTNLFYNHHVGRSSLCLFQMASKIPGSSLLHRTDLLADRLAEAKADTSRNTRLKVADFFPTTFRLYNLQECQRFFEILQSKKFKSLMRHRIVFTIKNADHTREDSLDFLEVHKLIRIYKRGALCGQIKNRNVVQEYNNSQLKFKNGRKFVLRVYMGVLSTQPLLVVFNRGLALLDRFNNNVSFNKAAISADEVFKYLVETSTLKQADVDLIYQKIKSIVQELNELARPGYLRDHRFFQLFAFDFILTASKNPVLVNWSGAPMHSAIDSKFVTRLLRAEMGMLHHKVAAAKEAIQALRNKLMGLLKEKTNKFEYLEDLVYEMDQLDDLRGGFQAKMREAFVNPVRSLRPADLEGMEVIYDETHALKATVGTPQG